MFHHRQSLEAKVIHLLSFSLLSPASNSSPSFSASLLLFLIFIHITSFASVFYYYRLATAIACHHQKIITTTDIISTITPLIISDQINDIIENFRKKEGKEGAMHMQTM